MNNYLNIGNKYHYTYIPYSRINYCSYQDHFIENQSKYPVYNQFSNIVNNNSYRNNNLNEYNNNFYSNTFQSNNVISSQKYYNNNYTIKIPDNMKTINNQIQHSNFSLLYSNKNMNNENMIKKNQLAKQRETKAMHNYDLEENAVDEIDRSQNEKRDTSKSNIESFLVNYDHEFLETTILKLTKIKSERVFEMLLYKEGSLSIQKLLEHLKLFVRNINIFDSKTNITIQKESDFAYIKNKYSDKIEYLINLMISFTPNMITNIFASHCYKNILAFTDVNERLQIWKILEKEVLSLSMHQVANRCIQDLISSATSYEEEIYITDLFFNNKLKRTEASYYTNLMTDNYGFYVLIEIMKLIDSGRQRHSINQEYTNININNYNRYNSNHTLNNLISILDKIIPNTFNIIINKNGCNLFKFIIEIIQKYQNPSISYNNSIYFIKYKEILISQLIIKLDILINNKYGHYGILNVFNSFDLKDCKDLIKKIISNIEEYCTSSFSYKVVKKLLNIEKFQVSYSISLI